MSEEFPLSLGDVEEAQRRLSGVAERTPLLFFRRLARELGSEVYLKAENFQCTGSFKFRGAFVKLASMPGERRGSGVITYSSGNHGQAVAYAGHLLGVPVTVVMPEDAVARKVEGARRWGARVLFAGRTSLERQRRAEALAVEEDLAVIPPFDDWDIIRGQATVGKEIWEDLPGVRSVVVPIGGGGLISGISLFFRLAAPHVQVFGVEPEAAADAQASLRQGRRVALEGVPATIADGLRTTVIGEKSFSIISRTVADIVTVSDAEILQALWLLFDEYRLVVEPSGATAMAALLSGRLTPPPPTAVVLSGGNLDLRLLSSP